MVLALYLMAVILIQEALQVGKAASLGFMLLMLIILLTPAALPVHPPLRSLALPLTSAGASADVSREGSGSSGRPARLPRGFPTVPCL